MLKIFIAGILLYGTVFGQADGYYPLDIEPQFVKKFNIESLTVWEYHVDGEGNPIGEGRKHHKFFYDKAGFKQLEIDFDSLGNLQFVTEYFERKGDEEWMVPVWGKVWVTDSDGEIVLEQEVSLNEDADSVWVGGYRFFKPCYGDYLYEFDENGLKKSARFVLPKEGWIYSNREAGKVVELLSV